MAATTAPLAAGLLEWVQDRVPAVASVLSQPSHFPLERALQLPLDLQRWDWAQLNLLGAHAFRWDYGATPFTNWQVIAIAWAVYFTTILGIKLVMRNFSSGFKLENVAAIHNVILLLWSLGMFVFITIDIAAIYREEGLVAMFCTTQVEQMRGRLFYGLYVYYLSKFYELLDTVILVLKKKPVIFLHWFHHAIVILMAWSWVHYGLVYASLGMWANTLVHVFMYYYYFRTALGHKVWFKKYITKGQIVQFSVSFALSVPFMYFQLTQSCFGLDAFVFSMVCNGIFLILFVRFHESAYAAKGDGAVAPKGAKAKTS